MALARDASTDGGAATATTHTYSHTCTGSNLFLIVTVLINDNDDWITGVTYAGTAMFRIATHEGGGGRQYVYGLLAPSTGANNVVVTSATSKTIVSYASSYTDVHQTYPIDGVNCDENNGISSGAWNGTSVTTRHTDCWGILSSSKSAGGTMSAGGGSTERADGDGFGLFDSNAALGAPASESMNAFASDGTQNWSHIMVTIIPTGATIASTPMFINMSHGNDVDWTHNVPTGLTNSILVVMMGTHQGNITGITYNGDAMTKIAEGSSSFDEDGSVWVLLNPDTGSNTIDVTRSGGSWHGGIAMTLDHVKQTTTITNVSEGGSESSPNISITPSSNDNLIIGAIGAEALTFGDSNSWWLGNHRDTSNDYEVMGGQMYRQSTAAAYDFEFFLSSGQRYGLAVIALEPAPTGTDHTQSCNETITIVDSISKNPNKRANETVTIVDTLAKSLSRSLFEHFRVNDGDEIFKHDFGAGSNLDDFNNWGGGEVYITGGILRIDSVTWGSYEGMETARMDLTNKSTEIQLVDAGNQSITSWEVYPLQYFLDSNNKLETGVAGGTVFARKIVGGVSTGVWSDTYDSNVHKWFRIRELNGTIYFDTSVDGLSWTNRHSEATPFALSNVMIEILTGTWQAEATLTHSEMDNLVIRKLNRGVVASISRSLAEAFSIVDTISSTISKVLTLNETITVTDSVSKNPSRNLAETVSLVDTLTKAPSKNLSENVTVVDSISKNPARSFSENITVVDTVSKALSRTLNETVSVVDTLSKAVAKTFNETISLVDTISKAISRAFGENVTVTDSISKNPSKTFNENVSVVDTRAIALDRSFGENITVTDSISKNPQRSFTENFTVVDTISKGISRSLNEVISIVDLMFGVIPQRIGRYISTLRQSGTVTALKQKAGSVILKQKK